MRLTMGCFFVPRGASQFVISSSGEHAGRSAHLAQCLGDGWCAVMHGGVAEEAMHTVPAVLGIERFRFTCADCAYRWLGDYDVQTVPGPDGRTVDYFSFNGLFTQAPTEPGAVTCLRCHSRRLQVRLMARRTVPSLRRSRREFGWPTTVFRCAERRKAPMLPGLRAGTSTRPADHRSR